MFFDRYSALCKGKGKSPTGVAIELNVSRATVNYWKNGNVPKQEILIKIANYFDVSVDYLLGKEAESLKQKEAANDDDLLFALFGGDAEYISDEAFEDVKRFAQIVAEKEKLKRMTENE